MNRIQKLLFFSGAFLCLVLGFSHLFAALLLFVLLDSAIASLGPRRSCLYANQFGTLATATIVQEALELIYAIRPVLRSVSLGFTDRNGSPIAAFNQPVITRTLGIPTVQNAGAGATDRADADVSVTLNQYKQLLYLYTPQQYSGTNRDLVREGATPMAVALANFMVDQIGALWVPGNFPVRTTADAVANGATVTKTIIGAGWDYAHLVAQRAILNKAGVPDLPVGTGFPSPLKRFYVGDSDVYASMLDDQRIVAALYNPQNKNAIEMGMLPEVAGFNLAEYPNLNNVATNAGTNPYAFVKGFCGTPDSTVYAARVPRDPREVIPGLPIPGNVGVVTEPRTGLSVQVVEYVDLSTMNVNTKLLWMYGTAVGNAVNGQIICTQ